MSSSIYLSKSAGQRRTESLRIENHLRLLIVGALIVVAFFAFCCFCSQMRMTGGVATTHRDSLVDSLAAFTKLPTWLVWAANIGDQVLAMWHTVASPL